MEVEKDYAKDYFLPTETIILILSHSLAEHLSNDTKFIQMLLCHQFLV